MSPFNEAVPFSCRVFCAAHHDEIIPPRLQRRIKDRLVQHSPLTNCGVEGAITVVVFVMRFCTVGLTFFRSGACGLSVPAARRAASRQTRRVSAGPATAACRLLRRVSARHSRDSYFRHNGEGSQCVEKLFVLFVWPNPEPNNFIG